MTPYDDMSKSEQRALTRRLSVTMITCGAVAAIVLFGTDALDVAFECAGMESSRGFSGTNSVAACVGSYTGLLLPFVVVIAVGLHTARRWERLEAAGERD